MKKDETRKSFLDNKEFQHDLKKRSLSSGAITISSQGILFLINLVSTAILARILTPLDYGMISMVAAITGFASIFADLGLSTATIQREEISNNQINILFWINVGFGILVTIIVAAISPFVAWFYKTPQLLWITAALSLNFFIRGLSVQHRAILSRQMRFGTIAIIQILSKIMGIGVAIIAAVFNFHYWALVLNLLVTSAISVLCFWLFSEWSPGLPKRKSGVKKLLRFGSDITAFNIVNYFSRNLDNILIGRIHGSDALGNYAKAYQLLMMPITNLRLPMDRVTLPVLSRLQNEPVRFATYYKKYLSILSFISMPLTAFLFISSDIIIDIVLGPQWSNAADIFKILALVAFIQPLGSSRGLILLAVGNSRRYLFLGLASAILTSVSFCIGVIWGAKGVAVAYTIVTYTFLFPFLSIAFRNTPVCIRHFLDATKKPFVASLLMVATCTFLAKEMTEMDNFAALSIYMVVSAGIYFFSMVILSGGFKEIYEYVEYGKLIFKKNK